VSDRPSAGFEIPFAFDSDGKEIAPADGITGSAYTCPSCDGDLGSQGDYERKDGARVRRHFFHRNPSDNCSQESWEHWHAKYLIHRSIVWGDDVQIFIPCTTCKGGRAMGLPEMDDAKLEAALENGRIPDVTGLRDGDPVFLVEVLHTHAAEDHADLPWIEVLATEIIQNPSIWRSTRKLKCRDCERLPERVLLPERKTLGHAFPLPREEFDVYKLLRYTEMDGRGLYEHYISIGYQELEPGVLVDADIPLSIFQDRKP